MSKINGINLEKLAEFLTIAKQNTYVSGISPSIEFPNRKIWHYQSSNPKFKDFSYKDEHQEKYNIIGVELIFFDNVPVWNLARFTSISRERLSSIEHITIKSLLEFERRALSSNNFKYPGRGPNAYDEHELYYNNLLSSKSTLESFRGEDKIVYIPENDSSNPRPIELYSSTYIGGLL